MEGSEAKDDTGGGLGRVGCRAGVQCVQSKVRPFGAASVNERRFGLTLRSRNKSAQITRWVKHEGAGTRESIGMEFESGARSCKHERTRSLVHIGLYADRTGRAEILLRIPGVAVTCISGQPAIEVIAIAYEKAASVRGVLVDPVSARVFRKEASPLDSNFLPASFLRHRSRSRH